MPDAALVNFPTPFKANGQIAGHTNELARPNKPTNVNDTIPSVKIIPTVKMMPKIAQDFKAVSGERYLGMAMIPMIYPTTIDPMVNAVKNFAVFNGIPKKVP